MRIHRLLLAVIVVASAASASEVYVWTDEHGNKHFGDKPPEAEVESKKETYELRNVDEGFPHTDPDRYKDVTESISERKAREKSERQASRNARSKALKGACQQARSDLRIMQGPVNFLDDDGNVIKTTEAERRQKVKSLEAEIARHCK